MSSSEECCSGPNWNHPLDCECGPCGGPIYDVDAFEKNTVKLYHIVLKDGRSISKLSELLTICGTGSFESTEPDGYLFRISSDEILRKVREIEWVAKVGIYTPYFLQMEGSLKK